ncbi:MAG: type II toxin-antitoxin system VapC family toxin [Alphaproteobacteria bacterium]|nr:type II toxin-antitoxin system VapC family toxin [Alphaproteobacteria bacterium]
MKLLLDTCAFLWLASDPSGLSRLAIEAIENEETEVFLSPATAWEIAIKYSIRRLDLKLPPPDYVAQGIQLHGLQALNVTITHTLQAGGLPPHHKDPFDRLLIAQAQVEKMRLVTPDIAFKPYAIDTIW